MRGVHLDTVEPGALGQAGGRREPLHGRADLLPGHRHWPAEPLAVPSQLDRDRRRPPHHAGHPGWHLPAGVADLHPHRGATGLPGLGPAGERIKRCAIIEHDPAGPRQRLSVDHHVPGDQEARAAGPPAAVQRDQPLVRELRAARHPLLHRRLRDPVAQPAPRSQPQRREQLGRHQRTRLKLEPRMFTVFTLATVE